MLILLLLALVGAANTACSNGYQKINGGDCFKLYQTQQTFDSAESECVKDGGHLASVHSLNEQTALTAIMGGTTPLIGMKCTDGTASHCTWKDGTTNEYSNFPGGTPVIAYGSCVHLTSIDTMWYSWNCAAAIGAFLCRVPFNAATTCTGDYVAFNGGCAALKKTANTQSDAEAICTLEGGHLASIHSEADNTFYAQLASSQGLNNNVYIGLANSCSTCTPTSNSYTWTDVSQYNYNKFATPNFPNTLFGDCVQMMMSTEFGTLGQWTNIPCSTPLAYICWKTSGDIPPKAPPTCPPVQFYYNNGTIYSPNFPISIPAGQSCEYVMATDVGTKVAVNFPVFSTDAGTTLSLYDGIDDKTPKTILSGAVNSQLSYESATNVMKMIFTASAFPTGQGWQANFDAITNGPSVPTVTTPIVISPACPTQNYKPDVLINSPNYPKPYPIMSDCLYIITSLNNMRMTVEFNFYDIDECCDVIVVYDGTIDSNVLGVVSGKSKSVGVTEFTSTGGLMTIHFTSGSTYTGKEGWYAYVFYS